MDEELLAEAKEKAAAAEAEKRSMPASTSGRGLDEAADEYTRSAHRQDGDRDRERDYDRDRNGRRHHRSRSRDREERHRHRFVCSYTFPGR